MSCCNRILAPAALLAFGAPLWAASPLQFRTRELPKGVYGAVYRAVIETRVDGRCPESDVLLEVAQGRLPNGLELTGDVLTGIVKEFGVFPVRLRATNQCAAAAADFALEVTGKPILRTFPEELTFEYREGEPLPKPQVILVSASWADLAYTVRATSAPWLQFRANQGATPYQGSPYAADAVTVQVMPDGLAAGVYRSVMTFSVDQGANTPQIPVTFRVLPKDSAVSTAPAR